MLLIISVHQSYLSQLCVLWPFCSPCGASLEFSHDFQAWFTAPCPCALKVNWDVGRNKLYISSVPAFSAMSCINLWVTKTLQELFPLMVGQISKPNHPLEIPISLPLMGEDWKTRWTYLPVGKQDGTSLPHRISYSDALRHQFLFKHTNMDKASWSHPWLSSAPVFMFSK